MEDVSKKNWLSWIGCGMGVSFWRELSNIFLWIVPVHVFLRLLGKLLLTSVVLIEKLVTFSLISLLIKKFIFFLVFFYIQVTTHWIGKNHVVTWYCCGGLGRTEIFYLQVLAIYHVEDCRKSHGNKFSFLNPRRTTSPNNFLYSRVLCSCVPWKHWSLL